MKEEDFFRKFDMHVIKSGRKLRRLDRLRPPVNAWDMTISDSAMYQRTAIQAIEEVDCVEVLMPRDRLQHIIDYIKYSEDQVERAQTDRQLMARYEQDRVVRLNNPAVEKAYQKYVMLLELARK
jgi:hypothetical protein